MFNLISFSVLSSDCNHCTRRSLVELLKRIRFHFPFLFSHVVWRVKKQGRIHDSISCVRVDRGSNASETTRTDRLIHRVPSTRLKIPSLSSARRDMKWADKVGKCGSSRRARISKKWRLENITRLEVWEITPIVRSRITSTRVVWDNFTSGSIPASRVAPVCPTLSQLTVLALIAL